MNKINVLILTAFLGCTPYLFGAVAVRQKGSVVTLSNEKVELKIDVEKRQVSITDAVTKEVFVDNSWVAADGATLQWARADQLATHWLGCGGQCFEHRPADFIR